ncbi:hypothetical protein EW026_g890 [Hermanssonia centrifuga]|uniref:Uncharacterized protein n=1 Tax=Hermanssonia centrifuga TaxID=98765 RepID=A0A4S4KUX0_9APHY|nr:hypothetical protein EW026_g890 [Hermanssonia centrifuga]
MLHPYITMEEHKVHPSLRRYPAKSITHALQHFTYVKIVRNRRDWRKAWGTSARF